MKVRKTHWFCFLFWALCSFCYRCRFPFGFGFSPFLLGHYSSVDFFRSCFVQETTPWSYFVFCFFVGVVFLSTMLLHCCTENTYIRTFSSKLSTKLECGPSPRCLFFFGAANCIINITIRVVSTTRTSFDFIVADPAYIYSSSLHLHSENFPKNFPSGVLPWVPRNKPVN